MKPLLKKDYMTKQEKLWIKLQLCVFRDFNGVFGVWACDECMSQVKYLLFQQLDRNEIEVRKCHHSKAVSQLGEDFQTRYQNELPRNFNALSAQHFVCSFNTQCMTAVLRSEPDPAGMCLVAYQKEGVVSLIHTLNARNTIPLCSNCTYDKCPCYREFRKETDQKEKVINDSADI